MNSCQQIVNSFVGMSDTFFWHTVLFDGLFLFVSLAICGILLFLAQASLNVDLSTLNIDPENVPLARVSQVRIGLAIVSLVSCILVFIFWAKYYMWSIILVLTSPRLRFLHHLKDSFGC